MKKILLSSLLISVSLLADVRAPEVLTKNSFQTSEFQVFITNTKNIPIETRPCPAGAARGCKNSGTPGRGWRALRFRPVERRAVRARSAGRSSRRPRFPPDRGSASDR